MTTTQRDPITTDVNTDLTVVYRQGSSTLTLKGARYINTWLGRSFDGSGTVYAFMQFEAANGDYISILASQVVSIKAGIEDDEVTRIGQAMSMDGLA